MEHPQESRLEAIVFAGDSPTSVEQAHFAACTACAPRLHNLQHLRQELQIASRSQPSAEQISRYHALASEIPRATLGQRISGWFETVRMSLALDSRQAALGLRRAAGFGHRLLYSSDLADVELLLEPEGEFWQIEGDCLPFAPDEITAPYLVELRNEASAALIQAESDASGRFRLADVAPGHYILTLTPASGPLTPASGPLIEIAGLEIP